MSWRKGSLTEIAGGDTGVVVFKLEVIGPELGSDADNEQKGVDVGEFVQKESITIFII